MARAIAFLVILLMSETARAAEPDRLGSFTFEGVALGTSAQALKKMIPGAQEVKELSRADSGLECFSAPSKSATEAYFHYFEGKLYRITIRYDKEKVTSLGGAGEVTNKVVAAFGKYDTSDRTDSVATFKWQRTKLKRSAALIVTGENVLLDVSNTEAAAQLKRRQAKDASLGF